MSGSQRDGVLREYVEGVRNFGVRAIPTVIIGRKRVLTGAVPRVEYERAIERILGAEGEA